MAVCPDICSLRPPLARRNAAESKSRYVRERERSGVQCENVGDEQLETVIVQTAVVPMHTIQQLQSAIAIGHANLSGYIVGVCWQRAILIGEEVDLTEEFC